MKKLMWIDGTLCSTRTACLEELGCQDKADTKLARKLLDAAELSRDKTEIWFRGRVWSISFEPPRADVCTKPRETRGKPLLPVLVTRRLGSGGRS